MQHIRCDRDVQEHPRPRMGTKKGPKAPATQLRHDQDGIQSLRQRLAHLIPRDPEPVSDGGLRVA
jgi:hypothetical protein